MNSNVDACYCCESKLLPLTRNSAVAVSRCVLCGSLHAAYPSGQHRPDPWALDSVTPAFLEALHYRRNLQAQAIVRRFGGRLKSQQVLDYGCGQGVFLSAMRRVGIDAFGCDISDSYLDSNLRHAFVNLDEPWQLPAARNIRTLCLLDVLEHIPNPASFISKVRDAGVETVLVKVPMLRGPIGVTAQCLAVTGNDQLLQRLLLVNDISPHYSFFTSQGINSLLSRSGFKLTDSLRLADVGHELPHRVRVETGTPKGQAYLCMLSVIGGALAAVSPLWADTRVFLFDRRL